MVSRLHGHSSSSGAALVKDEIDPLTRFERKLIDAGALDPSAAEQIRDDALVEVEAALEKVLGEAAPTANDVYKHTYAPSTVDAVYPEDYTGLP
jgi:2-oxoisovalerate dehydrogenase E1 component alpha subunit